MWSQSRIARRRLLPCVTIRSMLMVVLADGCTGTDKSSADGHGFAQFNRRAFIGDRDGRDLTKRVDDLTGAPRHRDQLTGELASMYSPPAGPRSRPPFATPRSTRKVCVRTVALDVVWVTCSMVALKVVLIMASSEKECRSRATEPDLLWFRDSRPLRIELPYPHGVRHRHRL